MTTPRPRLDALIASTSTSPLAAVGRQVTLTLLAGAAGFMVLWAIGAREHGWLAFVLAGLAPAFTSAPRRRSGVPQDPNDAAPKAGYYSIRTPDSTIELKSRKLHTIPIRSHLDIHGRIELAEPIEHSSVTVHIPIESFHSSNPVRDRHVLGPALLDAHEHPVATFTSSSIAGTTERLLVEGILELHGHSRRVTFTGSISGAETNDADDLLRANLTGGLSRAAFGIGRFRWLVSDHTEVAIRVTAVRERR